MSSLILSVLMIIGPTAAYIPQFTSMKQSAGNAAGFSKWVSGILIFSSVLRVYFWIGKQFEVTLLLQSVAMLIAQLALLELCVRCTGEQDSWRLNRVFSLKSWRQISTLDRLFWDWKYFEPYLLLIICLLIALSLGQIFLGWSGEYVEVVGFLALILESTMAFPQIYRNYKRKSTQGLSRALVIAWVFGDAFKTWYFFHVDAPFQFIMCGLIQIGADFIVVLQMLLFPQNSQNKL